MELVFHDDGGCCLNGMEISKEDLAEFASACRRHDMKIEIASKIADKYGKKTADAVADDTLDDIAENAASQADEYFWEAADRAIEVYDYEIKRDAMMRDKGMEID